MKNYYMLLFLFALLPFFAKAQSNYKPGVVVTTSGDTLRGFADLKDWVNNPRHFAFKTDASAAKVYTTSNATFFEVLNSIAYQRYIGQISTDQINIARLSKGKDTSSVHDSVFLRVEQKGPYVTLFSYADDIKIRYFIEDNKTKVITELVYRIYFLPDNNIATRTENGFVSQLYELAQKYHPASDELKDRIQRASYNLSDFKAISLEINGMVNDSKSYGKGPAIRFFTGLGINASNIKPDGIFPFFDVMSKSSFFPVVSIGANIDLNPNVSKLIVRTEVQFSGHSYKSMVSAYYNDPSKPKDVYAFKQYYVSLYPQVIYNLYNAKEFKFYIDGGATFNFAKNSGNSFHNSYLDVSYDNYLSINSYWFSYPVKLGIILNKSLDISAAYSFSTSITSNAGNKSTANSSSYAFNLTSFKAGINYIF